MLTFITGNKNKLAEVRSILGDVEQLDIDLVEIQELDPQKIIEHKLEAARHHVKTELIVEDTSLYCDALGGMPGPLIKWFLRALGVRGLYEVLHATGNMAATAKTVIGYAGAGGQTRFFEGSVRGEIVEPRGADGFGWDPIFLPEGHKQVFAEMPADEKNKISMRRMALEKLQAHLK